MNLNDYRLSCLLFSVTLAQDLSFAQDLPTPVETYINSINEKTSSPTNSTPTYLGTLRFSVLRDRRRTVLENCPNLSVSGLVASDSDSGEGQSCLFQESGVDYTCNSNSSSEGQAMTQMVFNLELDTVEETFMLYEVFSEEQLLSIREQIKLKVGYSEKSISCMLIQEGEPEMMGVVVVSPEEGKGELTVSLQQVPATSPVSGD